MTKFHINPSTGLPGRCNPVATGKCKYGDDAPHFSNAESAMEEAEKRFEEQHGLFGKPAASVRKKPSQEPTREKEATPIGLTYKSISEVDQSIYKIPEMRSIEGYMGSTGYVGSKYEELKNQGLPTGEAYNTKSIAKYIRNDIKDAQKAGYLPNDVKYSVSMDGYNVIRVKVRGLPPEAEEWKVTTYYSGGERYSPVRGFKPEYQEIQDRLRALVKGYNYDSSNSQVDYFNSNFYGRVELESALDAQWEESEKTRKAFVAIDNKAKKDSSLSGKEINAYPGREQARIAAQKAEQAYEIENKYKNLSYEYVRKNAHKLRTIKGVVEIPEQDQKELMKQAELEVHYR